MKKFILCLLVCLSFGVGCQREQLTNIDVFYTADMEGFFWTRKETHFNEKEVGGYSVLKNFLNQNLTQNSLLLEGGNWFESVADGAVLQGSYITELTKSIPYSVASISEKDFIYGWSALKSILNKLPYPFVVSNIKSGTSIPKPLHDYQIRTINGIKVGIFGLISSQAFGYAKARMENFTIQDPLLSAQEMVELLRSKDVQYIIVLSSLGDGETDVDNVTLAEEIKGIDLILGSGKETEKYSLSKVGDTYILYPGAKLDSLSHIQLGFNKKKQLKSFKFDDVVLFKEKYGSDIEIAGNTEKLLRSIQQKMKTQITVAKETISFSTKEESPLGNFVTSCIQQWSKLDGVVINADSIRRGIEAGPVSDYDLYHVYPYGDNITFLTIKGESLINALEEALDAKDNFPLVAGFSVIYNRDGVKGKRIKKIILNSGRELQKTNTYRIATTDHVLAGGLDTESFIDSLEFKNTKVAVRQIVRSCLNGKKLIDFKYIERWKIK